MFNKIKNFSNSLFWHIGRGMPKCSPTQIEERYKICEKCDQYNSKEHECMVCGCSVNNKNIFMNKLAWADQECPLMKWRKKI